MNNNTIQALLLQPPPGDLTGPYPALCYLKSYARENGCEVRVRDLGIETLHYLASPDRIKSMSDRAAYLKKKYEQKRFLYPYEHNHYALLAEAERFGLKPDMVPGKLALFKAPETFYDFKFYKEAAQYLNAFYRLLTAVHYPTVVTPSEYPTARILQTMENILVHRESAVNPYIEYYENVLFPQVAANPPKVIGISMVFGSQSVQALVLGNLLKTRFPGIHITMGGAYLSQWAMLMKEAQFAEISACTDSVICGEGEEPFAELLNRIINDLPLDGLPGLIHRSPCSGAFHRSEEMSYTDIAAQPPPDYSDLDLDAYLIPKPVIPYCISRGCYWGRCVFCQNRYGDYHMRRYQTVPVEKAVKEMSRLTAQYGSNHFNFSNDVIDPGYLKKFSRAVLNSGKKFVWNTDLRAETAFTEEMCRLMADAGLNCVAIGFESGSRKILDAMDKGYKPGTTRKVMKNLYDAGIATQAMGFFGFPGETEKDGEITVRFLEDSTDRISYYVMGLLMVMPGSAMYDAPHDYGVTSVSYEGNPMMTPEPVWRSDKRISADAVNRLYQRLEKLENIYLINDYPYMGALSTNHGFLCFEKGPDILKRLQTQDIL